MKVFLSGICYSLVAKIFLTNRESDGEQADLMTKLLKQTHL